jgi:hypothetical protein
LDRTNDGIFPARYPAIAAAGKAGSSASASDPGRVGAALRLTPRGKLVFEDKGDAPDLDAGIAVRLREAFERGSGEGLWCLGAGEAGATLPPVFTWWRDFAARFVAALRRRPRELDGPAGEAVTAGIEPPRRRNSRRWR